MTKPNIKWYVGLTVDKEGKITHWTADGKGGLKQCPQLKSKSN